MRRARILPSLLSVVAIFATGATLVSAAAGGAQTTGEIQTVLKPTNDPLVAFRILFNVGPVNDPAGKEGLAALTASMISDAGSRAMKYEEIIQAMYPMATTFSSQVDKEMTVFSGTTHVDNLQKYWSIISGMLLDPGFREEDFNRVKDDTLNYIKVSLRQNNEEELGKEALYLDIYPPSHPYGHLNSGSIAGVEKITLDDVKSFYKKYYTRANLVLGLAGGYSGAFEKQMEKDLDKLPAGTVTLPELPAPPPITGRHIEIIKKDTRATAISLGFPIPVTRSDKDWIALDVARSYLGQHRNSSSHLFQRIRAVRGLNYGDYAYIEYFPRGMYQFTPDPNLKRRQQIFQIWIRPVEPENSHFALRIAMFELERLVKEGMTEKQFEETKKFLYKNSALVATTLSDVLGYALDARAYGYDDYVDYVRRGLESLDVDDVNRAIRKYLTADNVQIVMITKDADALEKAIVADTPSPIKYNSDKPKELYEEDKIVEKLPLKITAANAKVVPVEEVFAK
ncbi:MAG TPA: pitrilysin family protein [Candidatus Saccharimonadales bacterium]|nr:pitrilysin family protein [Candidatus Saccharimonadales bacterium]